MDASTGENGRLNGDPETIRQVTVTSTEENGRLIDDHEALRQVTGTFTKSLMKSHGSPQKLLRNKTES